MNTTKFIKYVGDRGLRSEEDALKYIRYKMVPQFEEFGFGSYSLIRKNDEVKIGTCGLYNRPGVEGVDLGFGLLPSFEGMGYAREAAEVLLNAARESFQLKEVKAITSESNFDSQKLLQKLGFKKAGMINLPPDNEEVMLFEKYLDQDS